MSHLSAFCNFANPNFLTNFAVSKTNRGSSLRPNIIKEILAMNFRTLFITILTGAAATANAIAAPANTVPYKHNEVKASEKEAAVLATQNFIQRSYDAARLHSPFATVEPVATSSANVNLANKMVDYAAKFLGTRYILGATGPRAFDCSGFTSYVFRNFGITLNRTSRMQYLQGERVNISQLQPGDLLFFSCRSSGPGNVGHVAMVASVDRENNTCTFIHASVKRGVTYQKFPDGGYFSRHFIGAKRILGTSVHKQS